MKICPGVQRNLNLMPVYIVIAKYFAVSTLFHVIDYVLSSKSVCHCHCQCCMHSKHIYNGLIKQARDEKKTYLSYRDWLE